VSRPSLYISTEAALSTSRLSQLLRLNPILAGLPPNAKPTLDRILSIQTPDLESQDHILRYQVPVAIQRQNIGLIVIDSIASNYRAEFERTDANTSKSNGGNSQGNTNPERRGAQAMAERKTQLVQLGAFLRNLARMENIAIVVANQVADRFSPDPTSLPPHASAPQHPPPSTPAMTPDPLTLDHQQRWFTGWGDIPASDWNPSAFKTPSLGLVWTHQIAARIALIREASIGHENRKGKRWMRVVFAPWAEATRDRGLEYEIMAEGVKAVLPNRDEGDEGDDRS
jgi:DNA repair protein RAD57